MRRTGLMKLNNCIYPKVLTGIIFVSKYFLSYAYRERYTGRPKRKFRFDSKKQVQLWISLSHDDQGHQE